MSNAERPILPSSRIHPDIRDKVANYKSEILDQVRAAVDRDAIVVVGMAQNPHCKKARKLLKAAGHAFTYLEYGSYLRGWRDRLSIKMWTGFPTYPQVFVRGQLVGGASDLAVLIESGRLATLLERADASAKAE